MTTTGKINIAGAFHSVADDGIVAYTGDIYDAGLLMSLYDINRLSGGIAGDYAWKVLTLTQYNNLTEKNIKTLYFISNDTTDNEDTNKDISSTISDNTLLLAGVLSENTITTYGSVSNNNLILN